MEFPSSRKELPMSLSSVERPVSALRQRMLEDMAMRGLRSDTQRNYISFVRDFAAFLGRAPDTATAEDVRRFQVHQRESGVQPPPSIAPCRRCASSSP
jgi:integrase/recombinase XerD